MFNTTYYCKLWIIQLQKSSSKLHIRSSIKHDYKYYYFARINLFRMIQKLITNECSAFLLPPARGHWQSTISKTATSMFFAEASIINNRNLEIVATSPKNNNPNISASFLIIYKFLFMFFSWITSSSYLYTSFLLGGIYVLEMFLEKSITFLNLGFWAKLEGRPS